MTAVLHSFVFIFVHVKLMFIYIWCITVIKNQSVYFKTYNMKNKTSQVNNYLIISHVIMKKYALKSGRCEVIHLPRYKCLPL